MAWHLAPFSGHALAPLGGDPFASLQRELNRVLENTFPLGGASTAAASVLRLDVKEDDKAFHVTADMPGMNEKDVEVSFQDGQLTIRGEKKDERDEKKGTWHVIERSYGSFARQLTLPTTIDADKIDAKFEKGVLTVVLPKQPNEQAKVRKIEVKGT